MAEPGSVSQPVSEGCVVVVAGYLSPAYAASISNVGRPRELSHCNGWILERAIDGTACLDAIGCYPIFACRDWSALGDDLAELESDLVSLSLVTDPFGNFDRGMLGEWFRDVLVPFKAHFTIDLEQAPESFVSRHHRRNMRKAARMVEVEICAEPDRFADDWTALYANLVARHDIRGIAAFSQDALSQQLAIPGLVVLRALEQGVPVGMMLWYVQGDVGYYHLGAYSNRGYETQASFVLFWTAIEHFRSSGLRSLSLGGGAGLNNQADDGLSRFKRGWSTGERTAYFCGRIFDPAAYAEITRRNGRSASSFFPAYRASEAG